jgi:hypothetical protein
MRMMRDHGFNIVIDLPARTRSRHPSDTPCWLINLACGKARQRVSMASPHQCPRDFESAHSKPVKAARARTVSASVVVGNDAKLSWVVLQPQLT